MEKVIWLSNKDVAWWNSKPNIDTMMDDMHKMIDKTIFDYIMHENMLHGDGSHIRSLLLDHPIIDELLHPYSGFVDVKMNDIAIVKHNMYVRCCEKMFHTKKDKIVNELVQSIKDIISHANSYISSTYYGKILDTLVVKHIAKSLNNNTITFNNVIHIKLTHDISEYSFEYVMYAKPDITLPTMDDKTRRFYDKI